MGFLPELSIERRVDVPKKFILPDGDIDSTNNKNLNIYNAEDSVEKVKGEEDGENQPYLTSTKDEKRSNDKRKRGHHNTIFVDTPQSFNVQNDPIQIDQPSFYGAQLDSEDQNNNDVGGIDIEGPPSLAYPSMNYLVSQGDELNYVIPSYQIQQPTVDLEFPDSADSSSSIQIPFHPQEEQQLKWVDDNIPQQQNQEQVLSFRPTIWVDDDASNNNNNDNLEIENPFEGINIDPESLLANYQLPEEGSDSSGIEISDNYQPVFMKKKRGITSDDENGSNDEQEILYLPVYSDPDAELVNRHKYSGLSKR